MALAVNQFNTSLHAIQYPLIFAAALCGSFIAQALADNASLSFVKPDWIYACHDAQKYMPHQKYVITPCTVWGVALAAAHVCVQNCVCIYFCELVSYFLLKVLWFYNVIFVFIRQRWSFVSTSKYMNVVRKGFPLVVDLMSAVLYIFKIKYRLFSSHSFI